MNGVGIWRGEVSPLVRAAANMMGEVRVWNLQAIADGKPAAQWTSPDFTSWGTTKTHHYCGGIYGLAFSPDGSALLGCGMGPMTLKT